LERYTSGSADRTSASAALLDRRLQPRCAAHGQRWWEVDVSYLTIRLLERVGLAWGVVRPGHERSPERPEEARAA
jgi:hypothetical protein